MLPDYLENNSIILQVNVSNPAAGAVLSRVQDGKERAPGYTSEVFSEAHQCYVARGQVLEAISFGVRHPHSFLYDRKFITKTGHESQTHSLTRRNSD